MDLVPAKEKFLWYVKDYKQYSPGTVKAYAVDMNIFCAYLNDTFDITTVEAITLEHLVDFSAFTKKSLHNSPFATARKVSTIKSFFNALTKLELLGKNPAINFEIPALPKRLPVYLSLEESDKLLKAPEGTKFEVRDRSILALLLYCGLRVSELVGLNLRDIDLASENLRVTGKGNKQRLVPIAYEAILLLERYMDERPYVKNNPALFISTKKTRLSVRSVQRLVKQHATNCGIKKEVTPHKLRHTCATMLQKEGLLREVQEWLGHSTSLTTEVYTHIEQKELQDLARRHPLSQYLKKED